MTEPIPWSHPCRGVSAFGVHYPRDDDDDDYPDHLFWGEIPGSDGGTHRVFRLQNRFECENCGTEAAVPSDFAGTECDS